MLTPARIFSALEIALKVTVISVSATHAPAWVAILLTGISVFSGAIVSVSGPVQAGSNDKVAVIPDVKP